MLTSSTNRQMSNLRVMKWSISAPNQPSQPNYIINYHGAMLCIPPIAQEWASR